MHVCRTPLVSSWSNGAQCWRPSPRLRILRRIPIRPLTLALPIPIPTPTPTRTATVAVVRRLRHVALSGILPVVGATTVDHHPPRPVLDGTSRVADAMTAVHHLRPAHGGLTAAGMTDVVTMVETVANLHHVFVEAVSRIRGHLLVGAMTARASVRHRDGRVRATATAIMIAIMTAEETTHGTGTGTADVDSKALSSTGCLPDICPIVLMSYVCVH